MIYLPNFEKKNHPAELLISFRFVRRRLLDQLRRPARRDPRPNGTPHHTLPCLGQHLQQRHDQHSKS